MHRSGTPRGGGPSVAITRMIIVVLAVTLAGASAAAQASPISRIPVGAATAPTFVARMLNGASNNTEHPNWGKAATNYTRVASANYVDGITKMVGGPNARYISDRIFNDVCQILFNVMSGGVVSSCNYFGTTYRDV